MSALTPAVQALGQLIEKSRNIVFFGGAEGKTYEEMLSIRFFLNQPDVFWAFYKSVMLHPEAKPNAGHYALARLEAQGTLKAVITQNIDGLHTAAGSRRVYELHGTVHRNRCLACNRVYNLAYVLAAQGTPRCQCGGTLRPDIVFYGEPLGSDVMDAAIRAVMKCDLLIVGGTSLTVYPAAGLLGYRQGAKLALINLTETPFDQRADLTVRQSTADALDAAIPA